MLSKFQIERNFSRLESLANKLKISSSDLYDLYTISLLDSLEDIKEKLSGDKLEISLLIKKMLEDGVVVDKVKNFIETYSIRQELKKLVMENKNIFYSEEDFNNILLFLDWKILEIKVSWIMDINFFVKFSYPDDLNSLFVYLGSYKISYDFFWEELPKIKVKNLEK